MPAKLDRCVKAVMESGQSEESAWAICQAQFSDSYKGTFRDEATFDPIQKTAISVRDGVLEYLGMEIGMQPPDQVFRVYRSPATIANAAMKMPGVPITADHVTLDMPAPSDGGFVSEAQMVDALDELTHTTIAVRNVLTMSDTMLANVEAGRREMSLGYNAELIPHEGPYDFEQINITPHHLAAVERGRCGPMCSFIDRLPTTTKEDITMAKAKLHKAFCDQEGAMNLQQIVELAAALPEAIKTVPVEMLAQLVEPLTAIIEAAKTAIPELAETPEPTASGEPAMDADPAAAAEEKDKPKAFGDAAVQVLLRQHASAIEKAREFLPEAYKFADKSTVQIMRDALATETKEPFTDAELPLVFKMLKKTAPSYQNFGDSKCNNLESLANKEL